MSDLEWCFIVGYIIVVGIILWWTKGREFYL